MKDIELNTKRKRVVLIICYTIEEANELYNYLKERNYDENKMSKYLRNDIENDEISRKHDSGEVIFATNLAGRGTDISLTDLVEKNGITPIHIPIKFVDDEDSPENDHNDITENLDELRKWRPDFNDAEFLKGDGTLTDKQKGVVYRYPFFQVKRIIEKMSKSKHNVINPDDIISKYGSDVLRMYLMFLGPVEQQKPYF